MGACGADGPIEKAGVGEPNVCFGETGGGAGQEFIEFSIDPENSGDVARPSGGIRFRWGGGGFGSHGKADSGSWGDLRPRLGGGAI